MDLFISLYWSGCVIVWFSFIYYCTSICIYFAWSVRKVYKYIFLIHKDSIWIGFVKFRCFFFFFFLLNTTKKHIFYCLSEQSLRCFHFLSWINVFLCSVLRHPRCNPFKALKVMLISEDRVDLWTSLLSMGGAAKVHHHKENEDMSGG